MKKFIFLTDLHYGYERKNGHKVALHDPKAMKIAVEFAKDFDPDVVILGGDILDCGAISHHNTSKPGKTEGLRIVADAEDCRGEFIEQLESIPANQFVYITGNHEDWLSQFTEKYPALEGMLDVRSLLHLSDKWKVIPQGGHYDLGKLTFLHGDQISGGEHAAKAAVVAYERSTRSGHLHTYQAYSKNTPLSNKLGKAGVVVPCLCRKDPSYGKGKPNKWQQGFNWGYVDRDGSYFDYVSLIVDGKAVVNGKVYGG